MPYDSDAQAYFDRIATAGGAITTLEKAAADAYIVRLKLDGNLWSIIVELWEKICADEVAALVKLKHPVGSPASITTHNVSSGDLVLHGIQGNGADKYFATGFVPADHLTASSQSYGVFRLGSANTAFDSGIGIGTAGGTLTFSNYGGGVSYIGGAQISCAAGGCPGYDITTTVAGGGCAQQNVFGSATLGSNAGSPGTSELEGMRFNGDFYVSGIVGGYFAGNSLTQQQRETIMLAREYLTGDVCKKGRSDEGLGNRLVTMGDSVTEGYDATDSAHRYANLVAVGLSMDLTNLGIASRLMSYAANVNPASSGEALIWSAALFAPTTITEQFGLNDANSSVLVADFQAAVENWATRAKRICGLTGAHVVIASPSATQDTGGNRANLDQYAAAAEAAATAQGVTFVDVFAATAGNVAIHPDNTGHQNAANAYLAVLPVIEGTITSVTVAPPTATLYGGQTQTFTATVEGAGDFNPAVTWSADLGSFAGAVYTAPGGLASGAQEDTITATSVQDSSQHDEATVTIPAHTAGGSGSGGTQLGAAGLS